MKLESHLQKRQTRRKNIRSRYQKEVLGSIEKEQKANLRLSLERPQTTCGYGQFSSATEGLQNMPGQLDSAAEVIMSASAKNLLSKDIVQNSDYDLSERLTQEGCRTEPEEWIGIPENAVVQLDFDEIERLKEDEIIDEIKRRHEAIRSWIV